MRRYVRSIPLFLGLASVRLIAQDTIHFKNGDRLSGRIKNMQRGTLLFSCPALDGDARVGWNRIARIESERTFQFQTSTGERFLGNITSKEAAESAGGEIHVVRASDSQDFRQSDIIMAVETLGKRQSLIEVELGGGLTLSKSNDLRQFNLDSAFKLVRPRYQVDARFNSIFATQQGIDTSLRHEFRLEAAYNLTRRWDLVGLNSLLKSEEQKLNLRTTAGGGVAYSLIQGNHTRLQAVGGSVWTNERYQADSGEPERNNAEGLVGLTFALFKFKMWTVDSTLYVLPSFTNPGRVRADWNSSFRWRLIEGKSLWWNFSQVINYDSKPPSNAPGSDYVTQTSLTWSFP